jgi:gamma-glutamyltranspeptidase / glutathione hydrolase
LAQQTERLAEDPTLAALFARVGGALAAEGDVVRQSDLAAALAQLRAKGVNEFYSGLLGQKLAEAAQSIGAPLTIEDLRNFKVGIYPPLEMPFTDITLFVTQPPASGGVLTAQAIASLADGDNGLEAQAAIAREAMLARARWMRPGGDSTEPVAELLAPGKARALAAMSGQPMTMIENPSAASVVAVDSDGNGVACAFTMNAPFGSARLAPGTGIILSQAPNDAGVGFSALAPIVVASKYNGELYFVSAAAGGAAGALAEALVLDAVMRRSVPLDQAMQLPRAFDGGSPDQIYREQTGALSIGRVNAIFCPRGTPSNPDSCRLRNDYRGSGLATILGED